MNLVFLFKSIVLLKNENQLLPLKKNQKIAIIGALANDSDAPLGNWRAHASSNSAINLLDGMRTVFESNFTFAKGCELSVGSNNFFEELLICVRHSLNKKAKSEGLIS